MKTVVVALIACLGVAALSPAGASAQSRAQVVAAERSWRSEPTASEVVQAALRYFRLTPESFDHFRTAVHTRALLPQLAAGFRGDNINFDRFQQQTMSNTSIINEQQARNDYAVSVGGIWDLRDLVFNPAEVQIYGLIGVQRDIMLEATRDYFLRRQLMLRLATRPPDDPIAYAALELAISQYGAILDVLTGGWFSEHIAAHH